MLEPPGSMASGEAKDRSSIVTGPPSTPATESAYAGDGEVTCAVCPTYDQTRPVDLVAHDRPP